MISRGIMGVHGRNVSVTILVTEKVIVSWRRSRVRYRFGDIKRTVVGQPARSHVGIGSEIRPDADISVRGVISVHGRSSNLKRVNGGFHTDAGQTAAAVSRPAVQTAVEIGKAFDFVHIIFA